MLADEIDAARRGDDPARRSAVSLLERRRSAAQIDCREFNGEQRPDIVLDFAQLRYVALSHSVEDDRGKQSASTANPQNGLA